VAKRVVASHVIFNLLTAIVSLVLLAPIVNSILFLQTALFEHALPTTTLALFHTIFNVLGVLLMWPLADHLVTWLSKRFKTKEEDLAKPRYLDKHALSLPSLALHALSQELTRIADLSITMAKDSLNFESSPSNFSARDKMIEDLNIAIGDYTTELYKGNLPEEISEKLPSVLRVSQYYDAVSELSVMVNSGKKKAATSLQEPIEQALNAFYTHTISLLDSANISVNNITDTKELNQQLADIEKEYQSLKSLLLRRGAEGQLSIAKMDKTMTTISQIRRIGQQAVKAFIYYESLKTQQEITEIDTVTTSV
jgi:phosphate:Na+ symporter